MDRIGAGEHGALLPVSAYSNVYETSRLAMAGPCILFGFHVFNNNAAARFIQLFDDGSVPANGAVPVVFWTVPSKSQVDVNYAPHGRAMQQGVFMATSTTDTTLTLGTADAWFDVQVV